jgi:hypothetical protein
MNWNDVGGWLAANSVNGSPLVGSLLLSDIPESVAAGASMVSSATGTADPSRALGVLQSDPDSVQRLVDLSKSMDIRQYVERMTYIQLQNEFASTGNVESVQYDDPNSKVRPTMAKQSWIVTVLYCLCCLLTQMLVKGNPEIFDGTIAAILSAPAWAYIGLRTTDKMTAAYRMANTASIPLQTSS